VSARAISADVYDFPEAQRQWSSVPIMGESVDATELLSCSDLQLHELLLRTLAQRSAVAGWAGMWPPREFCGRGQHVVDFGCGTGVESLRWASNGARVTLIDICPGNLALAARSYTVVGLQGSINGMLLAGAEHPYFSAVNPITVFLASGVLHHIPYAADLMRRVAKSTVDQGIALLLLYSDKAWEHYGRDFERFTARMDPVGNYATWYDAEKVVREFGDDWALEELTHLDESGIKGAYIVVRLRKKEKQP